MNVATPVPVTGDGGGYLAHENRCGEPITDTCAMADSTDRITPPTTKRDAPTSVRRYTNGRPTDPEAMRHEIQRTRERLSHTLDELELRIVREREALEQKKEVLWDRATLKGARAKWSREPWRSVGIAFALGYIIAAIRE